MAKSKNRQPNKSSLEANSETLMPIKNTDSAERIKDKLAKQAKTLTGITTMDAFQNQLSRLGYGQSNLTEGAEYPVTRMGFNYTMFNSMYRSSWLVRKIVDVVPSDMLKNWIKIKSELEPDKLKKIDKAIRQTKTKAKLQEAMQWGRLFGGAAALMLIDGDEDSLEEELDYDDVNVGTYKGLLVFDRWSGIQPSIDMITDINDPDFGLPLYYNIHTVTSKNDDSTVNTTQITSVLKVHHSRILRFPGRQLPYWERQFEMYWGESEVEIAYEEIKKRDNTSANIASLVFLANIRVLKMDDLGQLLSSSNQKSKENLYNVLEAQNQLMSNMGIYVMDKDDDFDTKQYSFGGLSDIYESFMLDVAGACEMPVSKLFGRNPSGFNSTGEGDLKQYYETIENKQMAYLAPVLDKLLPVICMSELGAIPDDFDWEFNPVMTVDNSDLADLGSKYTTSVMEVFTAGVINKATALKELKQQSEITGMWSNITDSDVKEAEEEPDVSGEDMSDIQKEISEEGEDEGKDKKEDKTESPDDKSETKKATWRDSLMGVFK